MVYCGKPSKGCGACRARKVKCDQAKPACKRCLKTNRVCPGYRDQLSLLFRDESEAVAQKAKSAASPGSSSNNSRGSSLQRNTRSDLSQESDVISINTQRSSPTGSFDDTEYGSFGGVGDYYDDDDEDYASLKLIPLSVDRRQQAIYFCFTNFPFLRCGLHGFSIDSDYSPTAPLAEKAMMTGIVSVGMANLCRMGPRSQYMKMQAEREYSKALKLTNAVISHPNQAKDDATLTAIVCMSLFEVVTSREPEKIDSFIHHTKGALALLQLRDKDQHFHARALDMFQVLRNEIVLSCLMKFHRVPPVLLHMSEKVTLSPNAPPTFTASHYVCVFAAKVNDIRIDDLRSENPSHDADIISRAYDVDSEIQTLMSELPSEFSYQVHTTTPGHYFGKYIFPFQGIYHTYESYDSAMILNHFRYSRLLLFEVLFNCYNRMAGDPDVTQPAEFKNHCYRLRDLAQGLALDICATVPYLCGFIDGMNARADGGKLVSSAGGLALLFPLYVAASVDGFGSPCSRWVAHCFDMIGREMGIDNALALVEIFPSERGMTKFIESF